MLKYRLFILLIPFFTTFFVVNYLFAQTEFEFSGNRSRALIPFTKARGLVVLPVKINGKTSAILSLPDISYFIF